MQIHRYSLKLSLLALFSAASAVHAQTPIVGGSPIAGGAADPTVFVGPGGGNVGVAQPQIISPAPKAPISTVVGQPQIISPAPMPTSGKPPAPKPTSGNSHVVVVPNVGPQIEVSKGNTTILGPGQGQYTGVSLPSSGGSVGTKPPAQNSQFSFFPIPMKTKAQCIAAFDHEIDSFSAELAAAKKAGRMNPEAEKKAKALALEKNSPAMSKIASGPTCQAEHAKYAADRAEFVWALSRFKPSTQMQCMAELDHQRKAFAKEGAFALEHAGTSKDKKMLETILGPETVFAGMAKLPLTFATPSDCDKMQIKLLNERGRLMAEFYPMEKK